MTLLPSGVWIAPPEADPDAETGIYHVTVTSLSAAWTYTIVHGQAPAPAADTVLCDPLVFTWENTEAQVPGHLNAQRVAVVLASRSSAVQPDVQMGDVLAVSVRLGTPAEPGPHLVHLPLLRVTEVLDDLDPHTEDYPAVLSIAAVDLNADLASTSPGTPMQGTNEVGFAPDTRAALIGQVLGLSIASPDWWPATPDGATTALTLAWPDLNGLELLRALCNSFAAYGVHHTLVPSGVTGAYPPGYSWVGRASGDAVYVPTDPASYVRYCLVPLSRYRPFGGLTETTVPARYVATPLRGRKGREHLINTPVIAGEDVYFPPIPAGQPSALATTKAMSREFPGADAYATGRRARTVKTHLTIRKWGPNVAYEDPTLGAVLAARIFRTNPADLATSPWTFDGFTIHGEDMTPAERAAILPRLAPSLPGTAGDGVLARHVTITGLADVTQPTGTDELAGFVVRGSLTIAAGRLTYNLTLTPGQPTTTNPHTIGP